MNKTAKPKGKMMVSSKFLMNLSMEKKRTVRARNKPVTFLVRMGLLTVEYGFFCSEFINTKDVILRLRTS